MAFPNHNVVYYSWLCLVFVCSYYIALEIALHVVVLALGYFGYKYLLQQTASHVGIRGQGVVITGCDTGFGHHAALAMDKLGLTVFAGCLSDDSAGARLLKKKGTKRLHVVQMDVTSDKQVQNVHQYVLEHLPRAGLWAVINNAAINRLCDFELLPLDIIKKVAEVNYWGMLRTTKAFIALIRENKGRVINVTSVRGRTGYPTDTCYGPTKWAGEAFSDILRREMYRFGVKVIVVEPGNFGGITGMLNAENLAKIDKDMKGVWAAVPSEVKAVYGTGYMDNLLAGLRSCGTSTHPSVDPVTGALVDAVTNCNPQYRYLIRGGNRALDFYHVSAIVNAYLPESLMDLFVRIMDPPPVVATTSEK